MSQVEALISEAEAGTVPMPQAELDKALSQTKLADRRLKAYVKLAPSEKMEDMAAELKKSAAGQAVASGKKHVAIVIDAKLICESGCQGKYRPPPVRPSHLSRLLGAVLAVRSTAPAEESPVLGPNDIIIAPDGAKGKDWEEKLMKSLLPWKPEVMYQFVVYTQESLSQRFERMHSSKPLEQMETVLYLGSRYPTFRYAPRKLAPKQSTRGNVLGPLDKPSLADSDSTWQVQWGDKKEMYGANNLPLPGGANPGKETKADQDSKTPTKKTDIVPAFYHEGPAALATELAHTVDAMAIIDLTPGSGHWALEAVRLKVPYIGFAFTEKHVAMLYAKLRSRLLTMMLDANDSELYNAQLSALVVANRKQSPEGTPAGASAAAGADASGGHRCGWCQCGRWRGCRRRRRRGLGDGCCRHGCQGGLAGADRVGARPERRRERSRS